ncbi:MAG: hypothetical protein ACFFD8_04985 [Candidatus Thorarchaeota archaeon]
MKKSLALGLLLVGLITSFSLTSFIETHPVVGSAKQFPIPVDLVPNWNFTDTEFGGWDGNDHNASKPTIWHFTGDSTGPKEQYCVINDTDNEGDADTLFLQPTHTNQAHTIMFWQDFTPVDINQVTIHYCSRATGPSSVFLLYGLNASIIPDTPLPNGTYPCLRLLHPHNNSTPGYWPTYTSVSVSLSNLTTPYHHYRIHWQITEVPGKPDAQLFITYCRVTEPQLLPPILPFLGAIPVIHAIIIVITVIVILVIMALLYLKQEGKLHFPNINR